MPSAYTSFEILPDDSAEVRRDKLYLGIISIGEDLYCKGAALAEMLKSLNQLEKQIAQMRKELDNLKSLPMNNRTDYT